MKTQALLAATATAALMAGAAYAQDTDFATVDADASGAVSLEEAQTVDATLTADDIAAYDADGDGELSESEFTAWASAAAAEETALESDETGEAVTATPAREEDVEADPMMDEPVVEDPMAEAETDPDVTDPAVDPIDDMDVEAETDAGADMGAADVEADAAVDAGADASAGDGDQDISAEEAETNVEAGLSPAGETPEAAENNEPTSEDDVALPAKLTSPEATGQASGAATTAAAPADVIDADYGTEDDQVSLLGSFSAIDADGNFEISANEWSNWQAEDSANRTTAFADLDADGSGRVVFTEFAEGYDWTPVAAVAVPAEPVVDDMDAGMETEADMDAEADMEMDAADDAMMDDDAITDEPVEDDPMADPADMPDVADDPMDPDMDVMDDETMIEDPVEDDPQQ